MDTITTTTSSQVISFDYSSLDEETSDYLRRATLNIANSYADIGAVLADAQERLANHNNGVFEKWYTSLGMSKNIVYNFIHIHNFRQQMLTSSQNGTTALEVFDNLPKTLQADISAPNAPEQAITAVLSGDITTHKEYIELKKRLSKAESENEKLSERAAQVDELAAENRELYKTIRNRGTEVLEDEIAQLNKKIHYLENEKSKADKEINKLQKRPPEKIPDDRETEKRLAVMRNEYERKYNVLREQAKEHESTVAISVNRSLYDDVLYDKSADEITAFIEKSVRFYLKNADLDNNAGDENDGT